MSESISADWAELKAALRETGVANDRVSSFLTSGQKLHDLKKTLGEMQVNKQLNVTIEQLKEMLRSGKEDLIITFNPSLKPRRLEAVAANDTVESKIFNDISSYSLSGLWVGLFLLVVLLIGINCMLDLKTNDRFARQNLWVGRES